jgi:hypothetical protein
VSFESSWDWTSLAAAPQVLSDFYKDNDLVFLQGKVRKARQPDVQAGKAPPPPPSTWDAPYGGNTEASTGIITILEMVGEDIQKDMEHALAAEEKAAAKFKEFRTETKEQIKEMQDSVTELDGVRGATMKKVSEAKKARNSEKALLKSVMERMEEAKPGCDFITVNYAPRLKNRQIEMDGLEKAKTILMGGVFTKPDASFLQRRQLSLARMCFGFVMPFNSSLGIYASLIQAACLLLGIHTLPGQGRKQ